MDDLKLEVVSPTLSVYQKKGVFYYGTDAVLLAKYASGFYKSMKNKIMCDLCSGTGIIPLMMCDINNDISAVGVEINKEACSIAQMSASVSGLSDRYTQYDADIKDIRNLFDPESMDFVTCNPPYMTNNCGYMCNEDYKTIARHEIYCTIYDVFKSASYLLRTGGNLFVVYRNDRLSSLFKAAYDNNFEIKDMSFYVSSELPAKSKLVVCRASKGAAEGVNICVSNI